MFPFGPARRIFVAVLLALVACSAVGCDRGPDKAGRQRPAPLVAVVKVTTRDVPVEVRAPVDLRPLAQADVGSKALGYLDAVLVDRGDRVKKGQLLAVVRPSDLPDQLVAAKSALAQTEASVAIARANHERAKQLAPSGVVSQQALQQAAATLATAEATQLAAKAQIGALAVRLGETRIESPLDGVVSVRRLDPGALVGPSAGSTILTVVRTDTLRVFISVNERDAARVTVGKRARVEVDALPGRVFEGDVVRMAPSFEPTTRTLDAEIHLPNPVGELRPGMYGRGAILLDTRPNAVVVPVSAVQISNGQPFAFLVRSEKVERKKLELGYDGGEWLEILAGLAAGDDVVVAGADGLADGAAVRVSHDVDPFTGGKPGPAASASAAPAMAGSASAGPGSTSAP